jgi:hypothetical protein
MHPNLVVSRVRIEAGNQEGLPCLRRKSNDKYVYLYPGFPNVVAVNKTPPKFVQYKQFRMSETTKKYMVDEDILLNDTNIGEGALCGALRVLGSIRLP